MSEETTKSNMASIMFIDRMDVCFRKSLFGIKRHICFSQMYHAWSISVRRTEQIYFKFLHLTVSFL